jgi:hypothetical protein
MLASTLPRISPIVAIAVAALLAGCGGGESGSSASPPGSPDNPLVAERVPGTEGMPEKDGARPGFADLVDGQSSRPGSRFTPCNLVTRAQAAGIVGGPIVAPVEAPQGPTCIYRSRSGDSFVTVAVLSLDFDEVRRQMRRVRRFSVSDKTAYCGDYGQPTLYVPLEDERVLSVTAPCALARQFAVKAVPRLAA